MSDARSSEAAMFTVPVAAYDGLMGRYLPVLGPHFADAAGVERGQRALDVGCGPGGLTCELVARLGADHVAAVDPSPPFVAACRQRNPGVDVRVGVAELLPFDDDSFDVTLASLVVPFMSDPHAGVEQMRRVTRPGGRVALCVWDYARMPTIKTFWEAAADPAAGESGRLGLRQGELVALLEQTGHIEVCESVLPTAATYADFDDWWAPLTEGVGPVGAYCRSLPEPRREALRVLCHELLGSPTGSFELAAAAWCAVGRA